MFCVAFVIFSCILTSMQCTRTKPLSSSHASRRYCIKLSLVLRDAWSALLNSSSALSLLQFKGRPPLSSCRGIMSLTRGAKFRHNTITVY